MNNCYRMDLPISYLDVEQPEEFLDGQDYSIIVEYEDEECLWDFTLIFLSKERQTLLVLQHFELSEKDQKEVISAIKQSFKDEMESYDGF